ncbi:unnamed protein product (macronuclear) [Paramecium tetraurelia]|uniref:RING-type domain-containing protein n=1 Tax=Paramecium tetraurelia TaxID=5888 RepID=A0CVI4_PARTE|nr:uncharacterized protein GSPATT00010969001 [Paramecium tetraurelia]CAK74801.1 unnamed protein product [Paramecium tetraurelia]|eukprot:XP_001442198.1 hypothetical protein (macronuclear) [Paramecium tetraurelia strain d4-2]
MQQTELDYQKMKAKQDLQSIFLLVTLFNGLCFLFNTNICFGWDYKIIIIYACTAQFGFLISKLLSSQGINSYCCFAILESTLLITYLLGFIYDREVSPININLISYTLLIIQFIILAITVILGRQNSESDGHGQSKQIQDILVSAIKSIGSLQIVFLSLKLSDQIDWSWMQTFIIIWFSIGTMILFEISLFIDLLMKCYNSKLENKKEIIYGSMWFNIVMIGFISISLLTFLGLGLSLDYQIPSINLAAFILTIIYYIFEIGYYIRNKKDLINQENQTQAQSQERNNEQAGIKERIKQIHRISISKMPQFMIKLSATYFKRQEQTSVISKPVGSILNQDKKFKSISLSEKKQNKEVKKQSSQIYDEELTKRFDQLLSSPRLKLEVSESIGAELSSRGQPKQIQLCLVCYEKESNMINQPCGHGGFCQECSQQLLTKSDLCLLCRKPVTHALIVQGVENRESLMEVVGVFQDVQKQ